MDAFEISVKRFDEFAGEYAERFAAIDSYISSIDKFCELIAAKKPVILELACGPGNITKYIKQKFPDSEYIAIDLAPSMLDIARQNIPGVDFRLMDVRNIENLNTRFDSILCSFGLPFLSTSDAYKLIADCAGRLNKNGVLYISTMEGTESDAGFEATSFSGDSEVYFNYHRQQDLEKAFLDNGFILHDIKCQDYIGPDGRVLVDLILIGIKK